MKQKSRVMIVLMIIGIFILSGCDLYNQLYGNENSKEEGVNFIPIEKIKVEENKETGQKEDTNKETKELFPPDENKNTQEVIREKGAVVVIAQETDLISLEPNATDPDSDKLRFFYSKPLNEEGKWRTNYGDQGEYTVTITASDGSLSSNQDVLIIVNKKEEAPSIDEASPADTVISIEEDKVLKFKVKATDLNKDPLTYEWKLDGNKVSQTNEFTYNIGFNDAGAHTLKLDVSDGKLSTTRLWSTTVFNVNRAPALEEMKNIVVKETEKVVIKPNASDPDGDIINITISEPVGNSGNWQTTYDDAGEYTIVITASDGPNSTSKEVKIKVENVNRPPVITGVIRK